MENCECTIARMKLEPSDIVVLKTTKPMSAQGRDNLRAYVREYVGAKREILVLEEGVDISALSVSGVSA